MRKVLLGLVLLSLVGGAGLVALTATMGQAATGATFTVNSTDDVDDATCDGTHCSLREAIIAANVDATTDTIEFAIPGAGPHTIMPATALPSLTQPVIIIGFSQAGSSANTNGLSMPSNAVYKIIIDGDNTPSGNGFFIDGGDSEIRGLVINNFNAANSRGVWIGSDNNIVAGNYIGTDVTGTLDLGNDIDGVLINHANNNTIGGTFPADRNVISGNNSTGVNIAGASTNNKVQGSYVGVDATGSSALPNGHGITLGGASGATSDNLIGGAVVGQSNVISGNNANGVAFLTSNASDNRVESNLIGTSRSGTAAVPNGANGVLVSGSSSNTVGGATASTRNLISGNGLDGVRIEFVSQDATGNAIQGNIIGTDISGTLDLGNGDSGVHIMGASGNFVGLDDPPAGGDGSPPPAPCSGSCNLISGNVDFGVLIDGGFGAAGNSVRGNFIGTDLAGTAALRNDSAGVRISFAGTGNSVGAMGTGEGNLISGNGINGVSIFTTQGTTIHSNYVGVDVTGADRLFNGGNGVALSNASNTTVGGGGASGRNVISGNGSAGVVMAEEFSNNNVVRSNFIGTDATGTAVVFGNGNVGLFILSDTNTIGGAGVGEGNVISGYVDGVIISNGASGVVVRGNRIGTDVTGAVALGNSNNGVSIASGASGNTIGGVAPGEGNIIAHADSGHGVRVFGATTVNNTIRGNSIFSNSGMGIENVTGGNMELAPPVVLATGSAAGTACPICAVDVYSDAADEGQVFHGSTLADAAGNWYFSGAVTGPNVTATATDAGGNTSEFSAAFLFAVYDSDGDGCTDIEELGPDESLGGQRDPNNFYDFYDITNLTAVIGARDQAITGFDLSVLVNFGGTVDDGPPNGAGRDYDDDANGNTIDDGMEIDYAGIAGPASGPDGAITGFDLSAMVNQGGDSCLAPP